MARKWVTSSQRPCDTVHLRKIEKITPLGIWVILILPFNFPFRRRGYISEPWYSVLSDIYQHDQANTKASRTQKLLKNGVCFTLCSFLFPFKLRPTNTSLWENISKSMESKVLVGLSALLLVSPLWLSSSKETVQSGVKIPKNTFKSINIDYPWRIGFSISDQNQHCKFWCITNN